MCVPMQVETLVELWAIGRERVGDGNRFGPLLALEALK